MKLESPLSRNSATTLVECVVACALVAGFFLFVFELNGMCLRYIRAGKDSLSTLQGVQDRLEQLRNLSFTNLTTASYVQGLVASAPNGSEFLSRTPSETVTLSAYPTADATNTVITRAAGANSATISSTDGSLSSAYMVKINVSFSWSETNLQTHTETTETIVSAGTKK